MAHYEFRDYLEALERNDELRQVDDADLTLDWRLVRSLSVSLKREVLRYISKM